MATNGVYIVMGEANSVVALLNKARRQYQLSHQAPMMEDMDPLLRNFTDLKEVLNEVADLADMNPIIYLSPFLDVIKAHNTNGPITEAALSAVAKFLNYGLIDANSLKASNAVESIAYAVVHMKFIGGKSTGSDECVLFKILQVLRSLLLSPPGILLSNEAVCDMVQSCFRIVFEQNLSLLLRKAAESILADMTQLIFTRLPTFVEDTRHPYIRQLVNINEKRQKRKKKRTISIQKEQSNPVEATEKTELLTSNETEQSSPTDPEVSKMGYDVVLTTDPAVDTVTNPDTPLEQKAPKTIGEFVSEGDEADSESEVDVKEITNVSNRGGIQREILSDEEEDKSSSEEKLPYGLPCCRELLRFLIAMINPLDRHNTESMVVIGLNLLIVALEAIADYLPNYDFLMPLIKDNLCRSLLQLLDTDKLPVLAATNRCCFLLFESMRLHLKFQLESYLKKLQSIVLAEKLPSNSGTEQEEMALESLVQLWRIPGLVTEMYLNFDCDLYCSNIFEDLTKLLGENSFPTMGGHTTSLLSLDALLVVIETIEHNCEDRENGREFASRSDSKDSKKLGLPVLSGFDMGKRMTTSPGESSLILGKSIENAVLLRSNRHIPSKNLPSMSEVIDQKKRKRIIAEGTELFNQSPKKGIEFLREKGILGHDAQSLVQWLRTNPHLDKKSIADYICSRKHAEVLEAFVRSFPFGGNRLDVSLRMFLETFRLPGEAAEISMVMQHFSDEWYRANEEPFNHVDAAFTLSYAIIMLNTDQHNPTAKRSQPPMTVDCFKRNLSGTNGGQDFDPEMLTLMYNAIKSEEIVMPAEQKGAVKEDYMWKVLLRRGESNEGTFYHAPNGWNDHDLFADFWRPAIAALNKIYCEVDNELMKKKALTGYRKCSKIAAYYSVKKEFNELCKIRDPFDFLLLPPEIQFKIVDEMDCLTRIRFTRCSKKAANLAMKNKDFVHGIDYEIQSSNASVIKVNYKSEDDTIHTVLHKFDRKNENIQRFRIIHNGVVYVDNEILTTNDTLSLSTKHFSNMMSNWQTSIKTLSIDSLATGNQLVLDLSNVGSFSCLLHMIVYGQVSCNLFTKINRPLSTLELYFCTLTNVPLQKLMSVRDTLLVPQLQLTRDEFWECEARSISIHIGKWSPENIHELIECWRKSLIYNRFERICWSLENSNFNRKALFEMYDAPGTTSNYLSTMIKDESGNKTAVLESNSLALRFRPKNDSDE